MKKITNPVGVAALVALGLVLPATTANAADLGGWSEETPSSAIGPASTVSHRGAVETKVISGTSNKRAHGWTTWTGVYHYTTAQLERGNGAVITSSGRKWGTSGTEAISSYKAFNPNAADSGWGHAKTYYGK